MNDSLTQEDVLQILKIIEASNTDELHLETGDLKLIIRRSNPRMERPEGSSDFVTESRSPALTERPIPVVDIQDSKRLLSSLTKQRGSYRFNHRCWEHSIEPQSRGLRPLSKWGNGYPRKIRSALLR